MRMFRLASRERLKTNLLKLLSSRQHIRPLLDWRFLQNAAGSLLPAKMNLYVANVISFQGRWVQTGWCVLPFLLFLGAKLTILALWSGPHSVGGSEERRRKHTLHENTFSPSCEQLTGNLTCVCLHFLVDLRWLLVELVHSTVKGKKRDGIIVGTEVE